MEITQEQFAAYCRVRESGVTNMMNVRLVSELTGLSRNEVIYIIRNYGKLNDKYSIITFNEEAWK